MNLEGVPVCTKVVKTIDFDWGEWVPESVVHQDSFSVRFSGYFTSPLSGKFKIGLTLDDGGRLYIDDKPVIDEWQGGSVRIAQNDFYFEKDKKYKIRVEYYDNLYKAVVRLGWTGYPSANIVKAVDYASKADAVIVVVGAADGEGRDRATLDLTDPQQELIKAVAVTNKPMVVVLATGNIITMMKWIDKVPAVVEQWYPGEEGGNALAEVLFGDYNPGGKLPVTFPQVVGQVPLRYNSKPIGSTTRYIIYGNEPLFPFGHGLSYTTFEINNLKLKSDKIKTGESLKFTIDVKNTGKMKGDEVVQVYLHRKYASVVQPPIELKDFKRITLESGETKTISFTITPDRMSIWDEKMKFVMEPGELTIMAGSSSKDIRAQKDFEIVE
jgi:beta-glucosidase